VKHVGHHLEQLTLHSLPQELLHEDSDVDDNDDLAAAEVDVAMSGGPADEEVHSEDDDHEVTAMDQLELLRDTLMVFEKQVNDFEDNPPPDQRKVEYEHKRLSETVLAQVRYTAPSPKQNQG
jgi:hypothetical protein